MNIIRYFVSFAYMKEPPKNSWGYEDDTVTPERGFSCMSLERTKPICTFDDIVEVAKKISRENKMKDVVPISWRRFESPEEEEES